MFLCLKLSNLSNIILLCYIFQNNELSIGELLIGELVALQEELAGWLVDYVVKPGAKYNIIGSEA